MRKTTVEMGDLARALEKVTEAAEWLSRALDDHASLVGIDADYDGANEAISAAQLAVQAAAAQLISIARPHDVRASGCLLYDGPEEGFHRHCDQCSGGAPRRRRRSAITPPRSSAPTTRRSRRPSASSMSRSAHFSVTTRPMRRWPDEPRRERPERLVLQRLHATDATCAAHVYHMSEGGCDCTADLDDCACGKNEWHRKRLLFCGADPEAPIVCEACGTEPGAEPEEEG